MIAPRSRLARSRVVLDTNVVLSGIFFGGVPGRILAAWQEDRIELVLSPAILAEYHDAGAELAKRYAAVGEPLDAVLSLIAQTASIVDAPPLPNVVSADPADDKFLACALAARVACIVSGDKHLLSVSGWNRVVVVRPRDFVEVDLDRA